MSQFQQIKDLTSNYNKKIPSLGILTKDRTYILCQGWYYIENNTLIIKQTENKDIILHQSDCICFWLLSK